MDSPPAAPTDALVPYSFARAEAASRDLDSRTFLVHGRPITIAQEPRASGALKPLHPGAARGSPDTVAAAGDEPAVSSASVQVPPPEDLRHVGRVVWQAAFVLADYLVRVRPLGPWIGQRVLELGAGTGVTGIALALEGAQVVLTDLPHILPLLEANVARNVAIPGGSAVRALAWGNSPEAAAAVESAFGEAQGPAAPRPFYPEVIIGADVIYEKEHFADLIATLRMFCEPRPDTVVYLAYKLRGRGEKDFEALLEASDFSVSRVVREALHEEFADGQYHVLRATYLGRHPEAPLSPTLSTSTSWQTATFDSVGKPLKSASQSTGGILGGGSMVGARRRDSESDLDPDTVEKPPRPHRDLLQ